MNFLAAEWRKLALANYAVDKEFLQDFVPYKTELDTWNGSAYVSLVGFMFLNTKLLGIKIPFHVNFEEVNLRFYVRYHDNGAWKRGVVFIKELVPKPALTFVANTVYNEHYETTRMKHLWKVEEGRRITKYDWLSQGQWQSFEIESTNELSPIPENSEAEFITEHYWGYTKVTDTKTYEYEVQHPRWDKYEILNYNIDVDYGRVYGDRFNLLRN